MHKISILFVFLVGMIQLGCKEKSIEDDNYFTLEDKIEELEKSIQEEKNAKKDYYTWIFPNPRLEKGNKENSLKLSEINGYEYSAKIVNDLFIVSNIKVTKEGDTCKVEGVIANISPVDIKDIKIACAILKSETEQRKLVISTVQIYPEIIKSGCANSFSLIVNMNSSYEAKKFKNIEDSSNTNEDYDQVGICIERYVLIYKDLTSKNDKIDNSYLTDTVITRSHEKSFYEFLFEEDQWLIDIRSIAEADASNDDGPGKRKKTSERTAQESYNDIKFRSKLMSAYGGKIASTYVSPLNAVKQYEFDAYKTNFERFKNSPCYKKLGFNPLRALNDSIGLEKEYQVCEKEDRNERNKKILMIATPLMLIAVSFIIYKRKKKKSTINQ